MERLAEGTQDFGTKEYRQVDCTDMSEIQCEDQVRLLVGAVVEGKRRLRDGDEARRDRDGPQQDYCAHPAPDAEGEVQEETVNIHMKGNGRTTT